MNYLLDSPQYQTYEKLVLSYPIDRSRAEEFANLLRDVGFFRVGIMNETKDGRSIPVMPGIPMTYDSTNGTAVVYDMWGMPWIMKSAKFTREVAQALSKFDLRRGAYVPHSSDGGQFLNNQVPFLQMEAERGSRPPENIGRWIPDVK